MPDINHVIKFWREKSDVFDFFSRRYLFHITSVVNVFVLLDPSWFWLHKFQISIFSWWNCLQEMKA